MAILDVARFHAYWTMRRFIGPETDFKVRKMLGHEARNNEIHSTRLICLERSAQFYNLTGIAARCDWILLTDWRGVNLHWVKRSNNKGNIVIYASVRQIFKCILEIDRCLREGIIDKPFVLITGSEDATLPRQVDKRERQFDNLESAALKRIATHPLLLTWFVENLDSNDYKKMQPIPCGVLPHSRYKNIPSPKKLADRDLKVLCAHRTREGAQWQTRREVTHLAETCWSNFCDTLPSEVSENNFYSLLEHYPFTLCVEGGGLDPSPKAWDTLIHGGIPIIRKSPVSAAYEDLPVVIVDDWTKDCISIQKLENWYKNIGKWQDDPKLRKKLIYKLSADYWWERILEHIPN